MEGKAFLAVHFAKIAHYWEDNIEATREIFQEAIKNNSNSKYLIFSYFIWEINNGNSTEVANGWNVIKDCTLPTEERQELGRKYMEYIIERGGSIKTYNDLDVLLYMEKNKPLLLKRSIEKLESQNEEVESKKPKIDKELKVDE